MNIATPPAEALAAKKPAHISDAEWQVRLDLAACYRLVDHFGMTDLVYNHITARVPQEVCDAEADGEHLILINEYGLHYSEITASSLVRMDLDGNIRDEAAEARGAKVNPAGFVIHTCIHRARHDVGAVLHTHTRAGVAVSCMESGLIPMEQAGYQFRDHVSYHEYEGIAVDTDEQDRLCASLGTNNALILRNHGLLACGRTVAEAFRHIYYLEQSCKIQVDVLRSGQEIHQPSEAVQQHVTDQWHSNCADTRDDAGGTLEWPALMRLMDRKDASFRT